MSAPAGFIELERTVASIRVGRRHRTELGDIDELAASIERDGLLQPITITPDGVLVCGARRLAAITRLGWKKVNVWVRSGISDRLGHLLAEQDDNALHKPLTQTEAAALYRERGSVDSYASFSDMAPVAPIGTNMRVLQLLGLNKPKAS